LLDLVDDFIKEFPKRTDMSGKYFAHRTKYKYTGLDDKLKEFAKESGKDDFEVSEIDKYFFENFKSFLISKDLKSNTIGTYSKSLKAVLNANNLYNSKECKITIQREEVDTVYLNEDDLNKIISLDLSGDKKLEKTRYSFLLLAYTGCRLSDLRKLVETEIYKGAITFRQQKTNNKVSIPLLYDDTAKYIEKCKSIGIMTNSNFNKYIREICRLAKIDDKIEITETKGGKRIKTSKPKYELVTSHTGRRSFCTNMILRGLPADRIMKISGHKTYSSFKSYIKCDIEENTELLKKMFNLSKL
jgi:integrase